MSARMRLVGWNVQPVVMADDGENLTPIKIEGGAVFIPAVGWEAFKAGGDAEALAAIREQIESEAHVAEPSAKPVHNGRVTKPARKRV